MAGLDPIPPRRGQDHDRHDSTDDHRGEGGTRTLVPTVPGAARRPMPGQPEADHLARYRDAYVAGKLSRAYLRAVVGELVVIDRCVMILAGAR